MIQNIQWNEWGKKRSSFRSMSEVHWKKIQLGFKWIHSNESEIRNLFKSNQKLQICTEICINIRRFFFVFFFTHIFHQLHWIHNNCIESINDGRWPNIKYICMNMKCWNGKSYYIQIWFILVDSITNNNK